MYELVAKLLVDVNTGYYNNLVIRTSTYAFQRRNTTEYHEGHFKFPRVRLDRLSYMKCLSAHCRESWNDHDQRDGLGAWLHLPNKALLNYFLVSLLVRLCERIIWIWGQKRARFWVVLIYSFVYYKTQNKKTRRNVRFGSWMQFPVQRNEDIPSVPVAFG